MSTFDVSLVADRLSRDRLRSYLTASDGDLDGALALYDWNARVGGAFHEDIGRVEVVFRNTVDQALDHRGSTRHWPTPWYLRAQLFSGRHGARAIEEIDAARRRARRGGRAEDRGRVIAELNFGFWRYLCTQPYLTSLWVPVLAAAFPNHPTPRDPRAVRSDVEARIQRLHFLRNRIAHHEPIHERDLQRDLVGAMEVVAWICADTYSWMQDTSRVETVLAMRP